MFRIIGLNSENSHMSAFYSEGFSNPHTEFTMSTEDRIREALDRREIQGFVLDRTAYGLIDRESAAEFYAQLACGGNPIEIMGRLLTVTELTSSL